MITGRLGWLGLLVLGLTWGWPLRSAPLPPFSRHMAMHMLVVAVAAPLLALGLGPRARALVHRHPRRWSPILASMIELVCVWAWHVPALHHAARHHALGFALEQATFLGTSLYLWISAITGPPAWRRERAAAGITGLLLTSMHMTLLGALFALPQRLVYPHHGHASTVLGLSPLLDQQLGGIIMLVLGGLSYLIGGLCLIADTLRPRTR